VCNVATDSTAIIARLMMSAAVPCIGALMAVRSAALAPLVVAVVDVRQVQPTAEHRLDVAVGARLGAMRSMKRRTPG
jgi:hypothetical protein